MSFAHRTPICEEISTLFAGIGPESAFNNVVGIDRRLPTDHTAMPIPRETAFSKGVASQEFRFT
jgi:hypothetical protein